MQATSKNWRPSCKVRLLQLVMCSGCPPPPSSDLCASPRLCLSEYNDTEQENNKECMEGQYFMQDEIEDTKEVCRFKRDVLSLCSGLSDTNFGYSEGKPCVLLKMNRVKPILSPSRPFMSPFMSSLTSPRLCRLPDHRPDAPWGPLHQLHNKGERARRRHASHVLLVLFFFFFHKLPLISLSFLPPFFFCLCLISFCMLSLTALG